MPGLYEPEKQASVSRGIFSSHYIKSHVLETPQTALTRECQDAYDAISAAWTTNYNGLRSRNEAYTRLRFIDVVLRELGWSFIPEQSLPQGLTRKRPDYVMFLDEATEQQAAPLSQAEIFRLAATVLEAKKAQHPLDQVSNEETPGWYPSEQVQDYLRNAKDNTGRFFNWAILTNGNEWRLYCEQATANSYFALNLANEHVFCDIEDFRLFYALFSPAAFERDETERCWLDAIREEALVRQEALESNLRKRIYNVLEELCEGFYYEPGNELTVRDLPLVYRTALIFLYRLLFVLFAESRGLLPVATHGAGANKAYRDRYSLMRYLPALRTPDPPDSDVFYGTYESLLSLFHVINGTDERQNRALGVTRYNGGLFDPARHSEIETWRVNDRALASVLRQLFFVQPPARLRSPQPVLWTDETVDYAGLEVRQLGDIYEGLLGAQLAERPHRRLELVDDNGENHREGIYYTPDWVVRYLVRETLRPLLDDIGRATGVRTALLQSSEERKQDNSYAEAVLSLNIVDPAMGSGHFLVRVVEELAEQIMYHPTTRLMTEKIVSTGSRQRSREAILADGRLPVPKGVSQEDAELSYWRRRVVEACIYGVDVNDLAVELAKLSLWLTCIAPDEPLNFLDHHLRKGNSLLWVHPNETHQAPGGGREDAQTLHGVADELKDALATVIRTNLQIEGTVSTNIEDVKRKEQAWRDVMPKLQPFVEVHDLWMALLNGATVAGARVDPVDYVLMLRARLEPAELTPEDRQRASGLWSELEQPLAAMRGACAPFHWHLQFPDVFFGDSGDAGATGSAGFDAVLGNPPYISTHTHSEAHWRGMLERRAGYIEDLYVHFTDLGFQLLRTGGTFGFIVADTFFTLESKGRMRHWLQGYRLTHLGQCDPFAATVDAAIFVARKTASAGSDRTTFIQARYAERDGPVPSRPERELPELPEASKIEFDSGSAALDVRHARRGCLRLHSAPVSIYRDALKQAFFEPTQAALRLYQRFNAPVKALVDEWWDLIKDSRAFAANGALLQSYYESLIPGDITLVGLIAEGGQGMRTANNARFIGYLEGTPQAEAITRKRWDWTQAWQADAVVGPAFASALAEAGGNPDAPLADNAAWEAAVAAMRQDRGLAPRLRIGRMDLYRIVPQSLTIVESDFELAWRLRKAELLGHWRTADALAGYRQAVRLLDIGAGDWKHAAEVSDEAFCALCQDLLGWVDETRRQRGGQRVRREDTLLRSSESYSDPAACARIAAIHAGFPGLRYWAPFRKGDPDGNRWADNEPLFIEWNRPNVDWFFANSGRTGANMPVLRNVTLYFTPGVSYTLLGNHAPLKARHQDPCVFDASASRLTSVLPQLPPPAYLALLNSDVFSFCIKRFLKNTAAFEISDVRMAPVVVPGDQLARRLSALATQAVAAKKTLFSGREPDEALVEFARDTAAELVECAPAYLKPGGSQRLVTTAADCLEVIERAVNWEAERLYGVEGEGPFDEF